MADPSQNIIAEAKDYLQKGQAQLADPILAILLKTDKNNSEALYLRGLCALSLQQRPLAIAHMRRCVRINPDHFDALHSLGIFALQDGKAKASLEYLAHAFKIEPLNTALPTPLGIAYCQNNDYENAILFLDKAILSAPENQQVLTHLALSYGALFEFEKAVSYIDKCLKLSPNNTKALFLASMLNRDMGNQNIAKTHLQSLLAIDADHVEAHFELSQLLLSQQNYGTGFEHYEWRLKRPNAPKIQFSPSPLPASLQDVHIHLVAEQGAGDAIHFARYLKAAFQRGARLSLSCHPALVPLFSTLDYIENVSAFDAPLPQADYIHPLMSLPHLLQLNENEITQGVPYLKAIPSRSLPKIPGKEGALKIGLVWSGSSAFSNNARRACPFSYFNQLALQENIIFYNFQIGEFCDEARDWQGPAPLIDMSGEISSYLDTAAYLQGLDLLIATDTSTPHLAGSLGIPVYLMVNQVPDWRWTGGKRQSQWYPSFTLFHQQAEGDWAYVLTSICDRLNQRFDEPPSISIS